jgi:hypothetical protein
MAGGAARLASVTSGYGGLAELAGFLVGYFVGFVTWPAALIVKIAEDPCSGIGYTIGCFGFLALGIWLMRKRPKSKVQ